VDVSGSAVLGLIAGRGLPLRSPLLAGPTCSFTSSAVARLSPDLSTLEFATYLDNCGAPAVAPAPDGSIYAGVSPQDFRNPAGVLRVPVAAASGFSLDRVANAFSDNTDAVASGGLYALSGTGFTFPSNDLGLSPSQDLPTQLGGVQVTFDGVPAAVLETGPARVIVAAPAPPAVRRQAGRPRSVTAVQMFSNGMASNVVLMPVWKAAPGLLSADYPSPPHTSLVNAVARNTDGTTNDANHPAAAGSSVTLFATGMGVTRPPALPGSIAKSAASIPVTGIYSSLEMYGPYPTPPPPALTASTVPGEISAVFQVRIDLPASINIGTVDATGVRTVPVALKFQVSPSSTIPPASNFVAIYVK